MPYKDPVRAKAYAHAYQRGYRVGPIYAWRPEEDALLRELYPTETLETIAARLGRSMSAVRNRRYVLKLSTKSHRWTSQDVERLKEMYRAKSGGFLGLKDIAETFGLSEGAVCLKAGELGLTQMDRPRLPPDYVKKPRRMFATDAELRAHISQVRREWHHTHEHPRGALGMKHSAETKRIIGEKSRAHAARMTHEEREAKGRKIVMTKLERFGTAGPIHAREENAYSRVRGGRRADLDNRYFRSAWEANYARYLNFLARNGEIQSWKYEAQIFRFEGVKRGPYTYTPDFEVVERNGKVVYHEVKGWMDSASRSRLDRMAKFYPAVALIVIGEEEYKAISKWKGMIDGWEIAPRHSY